MHDKTAPELNAIEMLAETFYMYSEEVEGYRQVCCQHEDDATVRQSKYLFHVRRRFPEKPRALETLQHRIDGLESWEKKSSGVRRLHELTRHASVWRRAGLKTVIHRGVHWESAPLVIHVWRSTSYHLLIVEIVCERSRGNMPEHPMRSVALALSCHEHLGPEKLESEKFPQRSTRWKSPREFLLETVEPSTAMYCSIVQSPQTSTHSVEGQDDNPLFFPL